VPEDISNFLLPDGDYRGMSLFDEAVKSWWLIPLLVLIGGLAGWVFTKVEPEIFEARAQFSISLDVTKTGSMTQYEEDIALNTAGFLISAPAILEKTSQDASKKGIVIDPAELKKIGVVERRVNLWDLRVRYVDPVKAAELANIWAKNGETTLRESYLHAVEAQRLDRYILSLETCLSQVVLVQPVTAQCQLRSLPDLQRELAMQAKQYQQERLAAQSLHAGLIIGPVKLAEIPSSPVLYNRNAVLLAGGVMGLLAALLLIQFRVSRRNNSRG
jgi:uncharacterized protein involved in exopolysaccharide biosynthesis